MTMNKKEILIIYFPPFLTFSAIHSFNLFGTLVFYNSVCHQYLNPKYHEFCGNLQDFPKQEDHIQTISAQWSMRTTIATQIPALFASLIFSSLTDQYGRKFAILSGQIGVTLVMGSLALFATYPFLNLWYYIAICAIAGSTGFVGLTSVAYAGYISDTTSDSSTRTLKMTIYFIAGSSASMLASGQVAFLTHKYNVPVHWLCFVSGVYGILAVLLTTVLIQSTEEEKLIFLKERRKNYANQSTHSLLCKPFHVINSAWRTLVQPRAYS